MAEASIGAPERPITNRSVDEIVDALHGRSYDLCALTALVDKLVDCDPPGSWRDVFRHVRDSLNTIGHDLSVDLDALEDVRTGKC